MSEHTPGLWEVTQISTKNAHVESKKSAGSIAVVHTSYTIDRKALVANARLIAAAPDLLEQLERILGLINNGDTVDERDALSISRSIAKAKGETP